MSDKIEIAIEEVRNLVESLERELIEKKRTVNSLCSIIHKPAIYPDAELTASSHTMQVNADAYYGKEIPDVIEDILRRRRASGKGATPVNEIHEAMVAGGYQFGASNEANAKRGLYISLGKNPKFHKLPNGSYGLTEWYPAVKETKPKNGSADGKDEVPEAPTDLLGDLFDFAGKEKAAEGPGATPPVTPEIKRKGQPPKSPAQAAKAAVESEDIDI